MTCREFADFLGAYVADELPADVRAVFERHLSECSNCERYLAHYRESIVFGRLAFAEPEGALPGDVPEDMVAAILSARRRR